MALKYTIQGVDSISGKVGSFLCEDTPPPFKALSPVFPSLLELFMWFRDNQYETYEDYELLSLTSVRKKIS